LAPFDLQLTFTIRDAGSPVRQTANYGRIRNVKTVAELTSQQDGAIRQQVIEHLMRQILHYDAEFRPLRAAFRIARRRDCG
jgi:hypothetical protein